MTRARKTLEAYPALFLQIAELAHKQIEVPVVKMKSKNSAISTRHSFNRFRYLLGEQQHPHAPAAFDLMVTIKNEVELHFEPRGLWQPTEMRIELKQKELFVPGIDVGPDEHDQALGKILGVEEKATGPVQGECAHEWDSTETFCLKCRVPKPQ